MIPFSLVLPSSPEPFLGFSSRNCFCLAMVTSPRPRAHTRAGLATSPRSGSLRGAGAKAAGNTPGAGHGSPVGVPEARAGTERPCTTRLQAWLAARALWLAGAAAPSAWPRKDTGRKAGERSSRLRRKPEGAAACGPDARRPVSLRTPVLRPSAASSFALSRSLQERVRLRAVPSARLAAVLTPARRFLWRFPPGF